MSQTARSKQRPTRQAVCYVLAFILPAVSAWVTSRFAVLQHIPFSLYFLSAVFIAALGGLWPSLLAVLVSMGISRAMLLAQHNPWMFSLVDLLRYAVLVAAVVLVSLVSERVRRSEEKLRAANDALLERGSELEAALNSSKCACWTLDLDQRRSTRWFRDSYPVFGRPFQEVERLPSLIDLLHTEDQPRLLEIAKQMRTGSEPIIFEFRTPWPNGELHWLEMRGNRVEGPGCKWRGVTVDITERKHAEAALLRSEKLAAMGRLASTVAHEINNPLEAVTNLLFLAQQGTMDEQTQSYLVTADRELARLSNITRLTLGFVRTGGNTSDIGVASIVEDVLHLFHHRLESKGIRVERSYAPDVMVHIAPHELRQIVTNLISNASDAVAASEGRIAVSILREVGLSGLQRSVILIEDNGSGIEAALLPKIFEPFFSTKEEVGTGIGLWVTRELVEKSGGHILVTSTRGGGVEGHGGRTEFRVEFPIVN